MGLRSSPLAYTILPSSAGGLGLFQSPTPTSSGGLKNAPKGSVTARLKGGCHKLILLAAAKKRLLHFLPSGTLLTVPGYISLWHPL